MAPKLPQEIKTRTPNPEPDEEGGQEGNRNQPDRHPPSPANQFEPLRRQNDGMSEKADRQPADSNPDAAADPTGTHLAAECRRQSLSLRDDPQEHETLEWLDKVADRADWK